VILFDIKYIFMHQMIVFLQNRSSSVHQWWELWRSIWLANPT